MVWLIIIGIVVVIGYYWLKGVGEKSIIENAQRIDDKVAEYKQYLIDQNTEDYNDVLKGKTIGLRGDELLDRMAQALTEVKLIRLWDKHVTTVMAGDKYSQQSKQNLYGTWFGWLSANASLERNLHYVDDMEPLIQDAQDSRAKFKATLEAFDYDAEQEEKDTFEATRKDLAKQYKTTPQGKEVKWVGKVA